MTIVGARTDGLNGVRWPFRQRPGGHRVLRHAKRRLFDFLEWLTVSRCDCLASGCLAGGWHDSKLTPAGVRAAASIAEELRARIPEDADAEVFSSDLQRALQTARVVGDLLHVEPVLDRRLREKSYGQAEGKPQEWLEQRFIPPPAVGDRMRHDEGVPGSEAKASFAQRVYAVMDAILASSCEHQVIVTHGFAVTFALASWIKMPIESLG